MTDQKTPDGPEATAPALTAEFTIGNRTYELVPILAEGESSVSGGTMVARAQELGANLGQEDGQFILEHQDEIPQEFRGRIYLVFTAWRFPSLPQYVAYLLWHGHRWYQHWYWLVPDWFENARLVRRVR